MNRIKRRKEIGGLFAEYIRRRPEFGERIMDMTNEAYRDGALDAKTKRLMALAVAVKDNCEGCTLAQTMYAVDLGASAEEILETCGVAMSMGGTLTATGVTMVVQLLKDLEML